MDYIRVTNCKGPHTISAANVGSARDLISPPPPPQKKRHVMWQRVFQGASEFKVRNLIWNGSFCNLCVSLAGVTYLRYTVLTSPNKGETAVHCCDPPLSVLVMLVSRNVFHLVSALHYIRDLLPTRLPFSILLI